MSFCAFEYPQHQFQVAGEIVLGGEQFSIREVGIQVAQLADNLFWGCLGYSMNIRAASDD
jgi:hypothetical protein